VTVFTYRAWDSTRAKEVRGRLEADSPHDVAASLGDGYVLIDTRSSRAENLREAVESKIRHRISLDEEAAIFSQMSSLSRAGVPFARALNVVAKQRRGKTSGKVLHQIERRIVDGASVSEAFGEVRSAFSQVVPAIVESGEKAGALEASFERLADLSARRAEARREVRSTLMYPAVVLSIAIVVLLVIIFEIVPKFVSIYKQFGSQLPGITGVFVAVSSTVVHHAYLIPLAAVALVFVVRQVRRTPWTKALLDRAKLSFPYLKELWTMDSLSSVADVLSVLSKVGVGVAEAVEVASRVTPNAVFSKALVKVHEDLASSGAELHAALARTGVFPDDMLAVVEVAQTSGDLPGQLENYRQLTSSKLQSIRKTLRSTMEPLMSLALGAFLGFIIIILYLPVFDLAKIIN
jgi:type IV pilus assembly protein PilC